MVKNQPEIQETRVPSLGQEHPRRRKWQPTPVFLPGKSYGQRSLVATVPRVAKSQTGSSKNTGVGCHFLLQCMKVKSESEVAQSCPTLSDPMDCSPPGSSMGFSRQEYWSGVPLPSPISTWYKAELISEPRSVWIIMLTFLKLFLAWRIPGTVEPGGLPSMGSHRVGHDWSDLAAAAAALVFGTIRAGIWWILINCIR